MRLCRNVGESASAYGYKVTQTQMTQINNYILANDGWSAVANCATFATGLWNIFSSTKLSCGNIGLPKNLANSIRQHTYIVGGDIAPWSQIVCYYDSSNDSMTPVKPTSLNEELSTSFLPEDLKIIQNAEYNNKENYEYEEELYNEEN